MHWTIKLSFVIVIFSVLIGIFFYPSMPDVMVTHWGVAGQPNGYMSKFWGLFMVPLVSIIIVILFVFLPKTDPHKDNYESFKQYYGGFVLAIVLFMFYINSIVIVWNTGRRFNIIVALSPALGALFYYLGVVLKNAKMNWFIGIRTPWTLSNENVWNKTHSVGGLLFKVCGVITLISVFFPKYSFIFIVFPIILSAMFLLVYSYFLYIKEVK